MRCYNFVDQALSTRLTIGTTVDTGATYLNVVDMPYRKQKRTKNAVKSKLRPNVIKMPKSCFTDDFPPYRANEQKSDNSIKTVAAFAYPSATLEKMLLSKMFTVSFCISTVTWE